MRDSLTIEGNNILKLGFHAVNTLDLDLYIESSQFNVVIPRVLAYRYSCKLLQYLQPKFRVV